MSNNTENRTPHQTIIELCNRVQELAVQLDRTQSILQTEQVARVKAERVISLIAHSTTGNYDWCREVCQEYLEG